MQIQTIKNKTLSSVADGYDAFLLAKLAASLKERDILYIVSDGRRMEQTAEVLNFIAPEQEVLTLPAWDTVPYDRVSPNVNITAARIKTLSELALNPSPGKLPRIVIASVSGMLQRLPLKKIFINSMREVSIGSNLNLNEFIHYSVINGYTRVEQVIEPGEYAVRGDIIDIFPNGSAQPLRIDLFDDEVERIRTFDPFTQRTTGDLQGYQFRLMSEISLDNNTIKTFRENYREAFGANANTDEIYEAVSSGQKYMGMENWLPLFYNEPLPGLFDYLPAAHVIVGRDVMEAVKSKQDTIIDHYKARLEGLANRSKNEIDTYRPVKPETFFLDEKQVEKIFKDREAAYLNPFALPENEETVDAGVLPGQNFSQFKSDVYNKLRDYLKENDKLSRVVCCYSEGSRERLFNLMTEHGFDNLALADNWESVAADKGKISLIILNLPYGFKGGGLCVVSEQDILGERQNRRPQKKSQIDNFINDISSLTVGELVVHLEHGIGRFLGLENITAGGAPHDCLKILYANDAKLFVPVENIEVVSRYGMEDENIQLDTLGGAAWGVKKAKVEKKIRDIAEKLIQIAAQRELKSAEIFTPPEGLYDEFCSHFPYMETDDQQASINDVLADLGKGVPMDRLVCGDVGFGKTEVALRAAFVVAANGAQVAVIAPTTLLARQHYQTFKKRFEGFPVKIRMLSRLVGAKEARQAKEDLKNGAVEIVIGTHALLAKDIEFANLGLLVIDEEQHFGVTHKEKLKSLRSDVHVLTLTATPIPRTLQLSLTGVKQLSVIATPPVDRLAVRSFVMPFDSLLIKEAIYREKFRNGQVFFVCPRISDILEVEKNLHKLVPDIRLLVAHGQMPVARLEEVMEEFAAGRADMLVSTAIIESGIDMPSVNTMIIHRADMFGLAQLYQLKGRVGRAKIRGYCYYTVPPKKALKPVAERRLNILQALDSLGSGFSLASYDMDIRGSGNVLGEEQSGHIKEVGMSLYHHMLEEEINRLKAGDYGDKKTAEFSPQISTGIPVMIPEAYVPDLGVRLGLYKRIGEIRMPDELADMREELVDRFGKIPEEVDNLLKIVEIKSLCIRANVEKVDAGAKGILLSFKNNTFPGADKLLDYISKQFGSIKIRQDMKLFVERDLSSYNTRIIAIRDFATKLVEMIG